MSLKTQCLMCGYGTSLHLNVLGRPNALARLGLAYRLVVVGPVFPPGHDLSLKDTKPNEPACGRAGLALSGSQT